MKKPIILIAAIVGLILIASSNFAQVAGGSLDGTITDGGGPPIENVIVEMAQGGAGVDPPIDSTLTDVLGTYTLLTPFDDTYYVEAYFEGFEPFQDLVGTPISGGGFETVNIDLDAAAFVSDVATVPPSIDFGSIETGTSTSTGTTLILNNGNDVDYFINAVFVSSDQTGVYSVLSSEVFLPMSSFTEIDLEFAPTFDGTFDASLIVIGTPDGSPDAVLSISSITGQAVTASCGNNILEGSEECDDNNLVDGDGCSANCLIEFIRGDTNDDAIVDFADGISIYNFLFLGAPGPNCDDQIDVDDDGTTSNADFIAHRDFITLGLPPPPPPYPTLGEDLTGDGLAACTSLTGGVARPQNINVILSLSSLSGGRGDSVQLQMTADTVSAGVDVGGGVIVINYDTTILDLTSATAIAPLTPSGFTEVDFQVVNIDDTAGEAVIYFQYEDGTGSFVETPAIVNDIILTLDFTIADDAPLGSTTVQTVLTGNTLEDTILAAEIEGFSFEFTDPNTQLLPGDIIIISSAEVCDDNIDNDFDGFTDCEDIIANGASSNDCLAGTASCEAPESTCDDSFDNDGDSLVDCVDPDCNADSFCLETGNCIDDKDNDLDGLIDCSDSDCFADSLCTALIFSDGVGTVGKNVVIDVSIDEDAGQNLIGGVSLIVPYTPSLFTPLSVTPTDSETRLDFFIDTANSQIVIAATNPETGSMGPGSIFKITGTIPGSAPPGTSADEFLSDPASQFFENVDGTGLSGAAIESGNLIISAAAVGVTTGDRPSRGGGGGGGGLGGLFPTEFVTPIPTTPPKPAEVAPTAPSVTRPAPPPQVTRLPPPIPEEEFKEALVPEGTAFAVTFASVITAIAIVGSGVTIVGASGAGAGEAASTAVAPKPSKPPAPRKAPTKGITPPSAAGTTKPTAPKPRKVPKTKPKKPEFTTEIRVIEKTKSGKFKAKRAVTKKK